MGVPKFYRWISERYPKINQVITDSALLPEFDHLYLDMNGIIHGCTHPNHLPTSETLSERDMMLGIMHYIDRIVTQIVKPQVSLFMAIDGVAPRAKLNQQRSRRFRSAKDLLEQTSGDDTIDEDDTSLFDSNCITPGTAFMAKVSAAIQYFIRQKMKTDPVWKGLKVVFSGHEVPGEGEHKIMEFLRDLRSQPSYRPNGRHCMYGQDADLIMLGLVSHEPHFTLLREIVDFNFRSGKNALKSVKKFTKESDFQLLHLCVLREYLEMDLGGEEGLDLERVVDDFVFLTFLVGNDFLPHLPALDIGENAFDLLFSVYKIERQSWPPNDKYLTYCGEITSPSRLESFLSKIGAEETSILTEREKNEKEFMKKRSRYSDYDGPNLEMMEMDEEMKEGAYRGMLEEMKAKGSSEMTGVTVGGGKDYKGRYYFEKLSLTPVNVKEHLALRKAYVEGLMWCLAYYYKGCISWGWFYPYHYGPMLSDLTGLVDMMNSISFEMGEPLKPFEQLMGCLPPASCALVPPCYRKLMCDPNSPIADFYPRDFVVDMNGKRNPWEGINLLPFIDISLLRSTIATHCPSHLLTPTEKSRNIIGPVLLFSYDLTVKDTIPSFNPQLGLPDITNCHSRISTLPPIMDPPPFQPKLIPGTVLPYPGFPSLKVLPLVTPAKLDKININCFGSPSRYHTTVLSLHQLPQGLRAKDIAKSILGKSVFVNWPMMHEAKVVSVSDSSCDIRKKKSKKFTESQSEAWMAESKQIVNAYLSGTGQPGSGGVIIGDIQIRLKVLALQGLRTLTDGSTKKLFGKAEADVPLQMCLLNAPAPDPRFIERGPVGLEMRFPTGCRVILTKGKYRGCLGVVGNISQDKVAVKVTIQPNEPPFGIAIARGVKERYMSLQQAAKSVGMHPLVFAKVTGSVFFEPGRYDLGLNLKMSEYYVLGYTKCQMPEGRKKCANAWEGSDSLRIVGSNTRTDEQTNEKIIWEYTPATVKLVAAYRSQFPQLFSIINQNRNAYKYDARALLGSGHADMLQTIRSWLDDVETAKLPRVPLSTQALPYHAVTAAERAADVRRAALSKLEVQESSLRVPPVALYREGSTRATDVMLSSFHNDAPPRLGDRVANLCADGVPFGMRGTVVAIHDGGGGCVEVVMDEEFIGGTGLQGACKNFRGKLCVWRHLMRVSVLDMGEEKEKEERKGGKEKGKEKKEKSQGGNEKKEMVDVAKLSKDMSDVNMSKTLTRPNGYTDKQQFKPSSNEATATPTSTPNKAPPPPPTIANIANNPSSQRKQTTWKEALGPRESSIGFKGAGRGSLSGYKKWQKLLSSNGPTGQPFSSSQRRFNKKSNYNNGNNNGNRNQNNNKNKRYDSAGTAGLKAILKIDNKQRDDGTQQQQPNQRILPTNNTPNNKTASSDLKSLLGMPSAAAVPTQQQQQPLPPAPVATSAASNPSQALLELVTNKTNNPTTSAYPQVIPPAAAAPPPPSMPFNFTYHVEGQPQRLPTSYPILPPNGAGPAPSLSTLPPPPPPQQPSHGYGHHHAPLPSFMPGYHPIRGAPVTPFVPRDKKKTTGSGDVTNGGIVPSVVITKSVK